MHVIIVGGGIIGLSIAYYLNKRGHLVTVIDQGDMQNGCSFGNAGYVAPSHFTPLASPGIIAQGIKWMLNASSPFYIKPRIDPGLIQWMLAFWKSANKSTVEKNAPHLSALLQLSRQLTSELKHELGNSFFMEEKGCLMMYKTAATEDHEKHLAEKAKRFGIDTNILDAGEVQKLEPEVEVNVRGAVLYPIDAHLHPGQMMQALYKHLVAGGVQFISNTKVKRFERVGKKLVAVHAGNELLHGDAFVLAAGSWLTKIASSLGIRLLLQAGKGYSMTFENVKRNLHYPAILVDDRVAMTPFDRDLRMGGTMEISGINQKILLNRVRAIFDASKKYYPDLSLQFPQAEKIWSGLRPLSPDGLPYIGRHKKYDNLVIAGGHAMLGLSLAAATGKIVEDIISNQPTTVPTDAFAVERFG